MSVINSLATKFIDELSVRNNEKNECGRKITQAFRDGQLSKKEAETQLYVIKGICAQEVVALIKSYYSHFTKSEETSAFVAKAKAFLKGYFEIDRTEDDLFTNNVVKLLQQFCSNKG